MGVSLKLSWYYSIGFEFKIHLRAQKVTRHFGKRGPWDLFLESPGNFSGPESCFAFAVYLYDQSLNSLENDTMKLLVNEAKWTSL